MEQYPFPVPPLFRDSLIYCLVNIKSNINFALAFTFWKEACKAGIVSTENAANNIYLKGFVLGVVSLNVFCYNIGIKQWKELLLQQCENFAYRIVRAAIADMIWTIFNESGMAETVWTDFSEVGFGSPSDPLFRQGFHTGVEVAISNDRYYKKLTRKISNRPWWRFWD